MPASRFTQKEMRAVECLLRKPDIDDLHLSEYLGIQVEDARKLREKLFSRLLRYVIVPNYSALGYELIFVVYGSTLSARRLPPVTGEPEYIKCYTHFYLSDDCFLGIGFARNYGMLVKHYEKFCGDIGVSRDDAKLLIFPSELVTFFRFFDYSQVLVQASPGEAKFTHSFTLGNWLEAWKWKEEGEKLDEIEQKILYAILHQPAIKSEKLWKFVGVNEKVGERKLMRLRKSGMYFPSVVPDLKNFGYSGFLFYHLQKANGLFPLKNIIEQIVWKIPVYFAICDEKNAFLLSAYREADDVVERDVILSEVFQQEGISMTRIDSGYFSYDDLLLRYENGYSGLLNLNTISGDMRENIKQKQKRGQYKTDSGNRR
ncbi:MAG: hypothetical protein ACP5JR_00530 [Thermoplasmata archaeon]